MAIGLKTTDIIFELYNRNFFDKISSVIDMGDQDVNHNYSEVENYFKKFNIKFDSDLFSLAKNHPDRPRVSSSVLWKTLGINSADIQEHIQNKNMLEVTVNFVSEIIACVRDKDKKIISGDPEKIKKVADTWKFCRDTGSNNPNWQLIDTQV